jgi:hypothetical protein
MRGSRQQTMISTEKNTITTMGGTIVVITFGIRNGGVKGSLLRGKAAAGANWWCVNKSFLSGIAIRV